MIWDGPTDLDPAKQNEIVEAWITRGVDSIAVSVVNGPGISSVLRKARSKGIKVITWDADAEPDARDFFINQATPQALGDTLADEANRILKGSGDFAIITGALTAANQNDWIKIHQTADRAVSEDSSDHGPAERRRPEPGVSGGADADEGLPGDETDHGDFGARGAGRGGGGEAVGAYGCEGDGAVAAEHVQAVCEGGDCGIGGALEYRRIWVIWWCRLLSRRRRAFCGAGSRRSKRAGWAGSWWTGIRCCWASLWYLPRRISISTTSEAVFSDQVTGPGLNNASALCSFHCSAHVFRLPLATSSSRWNNCHPTS